MKNSVAYVINLDRRPDRWQHILNMLQTRGFSRIVRIAAIDGNTLTPKQLQSWVTPEGLASLTRERQTHEELGSSGAVGCYLSHMEAWKRIVQQQEPGFVIEDDCVLVENILMHDKTVDPVYDVVLWGHSALRTPVQQNLTLHAITPYQGLFWGLHFYYLTPAGAQKLLQRALPIHIQVDSYMGQLSLEQVLHMGVHHPSLAWQLSGTTDVQTACPTCDHPRRTVRSLLFLMSFLVLLLVLQVCVRLPLQK